MLEKRTGQFGAEMMELLEFRCFWGFYIVQLYWDLSLKNKIV